MYKPSSIGIMERVTKSDKVTIEVSDGIYLADLVAGENVCMKYWEVDPGETLPTHRHTNEQIGFVISGQLIAFVEGDEFVLEPGDSYIFPSNERHGAENRWEESAVGIGVLSPPRTEPDWGDDTDRTKSMATESDG